MIKVAKFGGTSMADAKAVERTAEIVLADKSIKYVVVSAPGKRNSADKKVTDLLYACYHEVEINGNCAETFAKLRERFMQMVQELKIDLDIKVYLDEVEEGIVKYRSMEYCASRGEYLSACIMAAKLGYKFIDAKDIIKFNEEGEFDSEYTNDCVSETLKAIEYGVIAGFYGSDTSGMIRTFSRGGSDVTGSIIARGVKADIYENWTDVDGFLTADPRVVENPKPIAVLSYRELRELSYMGASVLHPEAIFPVKYCGIPIHIRNTFNKDCVGTKIMPKVMIGEFSSLVTGIAGKKNYSIVHIEKSMMNSELGFARRVLSVFEYYGVSFEHMPSGIDTLSVVVSDSEMSGKEDVILDRIKKTVKPDMIEISSGFSLIATVGHGMSFKPGTASRLFDSLSRENINIRMIDQGSSELNIIVGVSTDDYERAIRAIYNEFYK